MAIALIAILALLMILWAVTITFISLLPNLIIQLFPWVNEFLDLESIHWVFTSKMIPLISAFLAFFVLYRWIPSTKVRLSEAFWGAFIATIAWRIVSAGFAWFLSAGIINYKLIYGSLSTGLALLTWIYLSALITVFGSHMSAAIARARRASSPTDIP